MLVGMAIWEKKIISVDIKTTMINSSEVKFVQTGMWFFCINTDFHISNLWETHVIRVDPIIIIFFGGGSVKICNGCDVII